MMADSTNVIRARWVFPVDRPPIECGEVAIAGGRIVDVRPVEHVSVLTDAESQTALIPGLVNAHTHLEFTLLSSPLPAETTFAEWIRLIVAHRRARGDYPVEALRTGLRESAAAGVTTIAEIATAGWTYGPFNADAPRTVAFREAIALNPDMLGVIADAVAGHVEQLRGHPSVIAGISPHAPYSVHPELFRTLVKQAQESRAPLAVHLAETHDELELLANGTGPLVELFSESGFWRPDAIPRGSRPMDYLRMIAGLPQALVIHGNYLEADEHEFLAGKSNLTVVYCPRTHAHFRHEPHPWRDLMSRGVRVALGTDSRASNPDLSLWKEMQFLRERFPQVAPAELLAMGTQAGADSLGLDRQTGTLCAGKSADVAVVRLAGDDRDEPHEWLLNPASQPVAAMREGRWIAGVL
jgi:cytosine/adenosine deaminase-related metal-dependent hydrolase